MNDIRASLQRLVDNCNDFEQLPRKVHQQICQHLTEFDQKEMRIATKKWKQPTLIDIILATDVPTDNDDGDDDDGLTSELRCDIDCTHPEELLELSKQPNCTLDFKLVHLTGDCATGVPLLLTSIAANVISLKIGNGFPKSSIATQLVEILPNLRYISVVRLPLKDASQFGFHVPKCSGQQSAYLDFTAYIKKKNKQKEYRVKQLAFYQWNDEYIFEYLSAHADHLVELKLLGDEGEFKCSDAWKEVFARMNKLRRLHLFAIQPHFARSLIICLPPVLAVTNLTISKSATISVTQLATDIWGRTLKNLVLFDVDNAAGICKCLQSCEFLESLYLKYGTESDLTMHTISEYLKPAVKKRLQRLHIAITYVEEKALIQLLAELPNLTHLTLATHRLSTSILRAVFKYQRKLKSLIAPGDISNIEVGVFEDIKRLRRLEHLEIRSLHFQNNEFSELMSYLVELPELRHIDLTTQLVDHFLAVFIEVLANNERRMTSELVRKIQAMILSRPDPILSAINGILQGSDIDNPEDQVAKMVKQLIFS